MPYLSFISDEKLFAIVNGILDIAIRSKIEAEKKFGKNVIDPFSVLFETAGFNFSNETWLASEQARQAQKSLQNHLGSFHQQVLGSFNGWEDLLTGGQVDIVNRDRKIVAEVKNKHNTVKGDNLKTVYDKLANTILPKGMPYKDFTAYYVEVIPKRQGRYDVEFTPSDNETGENRPSHRQIRRIDGYSFYDLASGESDTLKKLFDVLPNVINEYFNKIDSKDRQWDAALAKRFFAEAYGD